jgi:hypothetical protein
MCKATLGLELEVSNLYAYINKGTQVSDLEYSNEKLIKKTLRISIHNRN